jgi:hypothetical protein
LASWAITGRSPAARTSSAGSSHSPASASRPLALRDLGREDGERELRAVDAREVPRAALAHRHLARRFGLRPRDRLLGCGLQRLLQPPQRLAQLPAAEGLAQLGAVRLARGLGDEVELDRHVEDHRRQPLGDPRVLGVLRQVLLALGPRDVVDVVQHALERLEALQQVGGRLVADPRDARDVVRGVALEPDEVRDALGRDAVAVEHRLAVVDLRVGDAARGRHDPHAVADELVGVAVAGHHHHRHAARLGLRRQGRDDVVGLVALDGYVRVAERVDQRRQVRPLLLEQVRPRGALRLVVRGDLLAPGEPGVPHHDGRHRAVVREDLHEHRGEAEDRVGRLALGRGDRLRQGEERPVGERVAVDQEELAGGVAVGHGAQL